MNTIDQPIFIDVEQAAAGFGDLPTLAPVAMEVIRLADDDRASLEDIAGVISRDPGLAGQLLKVANSAAYGCGPVASLTRAASILGLRTVKLLSLSFAVVAEAGADETRTGIWHRTLAGSALARSFAGQLETRLQEECFVGALLANLGRVALLDHQAYAAACEEAGGWLDTREERRRFSSVSDEVTYEILLGWGLPETLAVAVRHRSQPETIDGTTGRLASLLRAADAAAGFIVADETVPMALEHWHHVAAEELGLPANSADDLLAESQETLDSVAQMFDAPAQYPVSELLQRARDGLARLSLDVVAALSREQSRTERLETENERLAHEAMTDPLTGLPNRRAFDAALHAAIAGHRRGALHRGVGVLILDLDHFKAVNDTHGHRVGDDVLRAAGGRLRGQCRRGEQIARLGGEEFGVLLPSTDEHEIALAGERLRGALSSRPIDTSAGPIPVTTSVGAAVVDTFDEHTAIMLMQRADASLYEAKEAGRDRLRIAP